MADKSKPRDLHVAPLGAGHSNSLLQISNDVTPSVAPLGGHSNNWLRISNDVTPSVSRFPSELLGEPREQHWKRKSFFVAFVCAIFYVVRDLSSFLTHFFLNHYKYGEISETASCLWRFGRTDPITLSKGLFIMAPLTPTEANNHIMLV